MKKQFAQIRGDEILHLSYNQRAKEIERLNKHIAAQAATIAQLREENKDLRARVSCYSAFSGSIYKCKSCDGYYMSGYICACGRDNTYSDKEWNAARALKGGE